MKTYKDLTKEQVKEILLLAYDHEDLIIGEIELWFQEYIEEWYSDAYEAWRGRFYTQGGRGNKRCLSQFWITPSLSIEVDSRYDTEDLQEMTKSIVRLPVRNQWRIFEKFRQWDINPIIKK